MIKKSLCVEKTSVFEQSPHVSNLHTIDDMQIAITEYIQNADRAVLNTVCESTVRHANKCRETGGGAL
jgi:hypothetical protein